MSVYGHSLVLFHVSFNPVSDKTFVSDHCPSAAHCDDSMTVAINTALGKKMMSKLHEKHWSSFQGPTHVQNQQQKYKFVENKIQTNDKMIMCVTLF